MVLLDREQIKAVIPHREPFLLIDEVIALDPGRMCTALKNLTNADPWVAGHFPGYPVTPGVLMIEMLAQTGAVCIGAMEEHRGQTALFAKLDNAKFRRQVFPGEILTLDIEMVKLRSSVGVGRGVAKVGDEIAVTAELTFAFQK